VYVSYFKSLKSVIKHTQGSFQENFSEGRPVIVHELLGCEYPVSNMQRT